VARHVAAALFAVEFAVEVVGLESQWQSLLCPTVAHCRSPRSQAPRASGCLYPGREWSHCAWFYGAGAGESQTFVKENEGEVGGREEEERKKKEKEKEKEKEEEEGVWVFFQISNGRFFFFSKKRFFHYARNLESLQKKKYDETKKEKRKLVQNRRKIIQK